MERRQEIIDWLNDIHAMERALEITLEKQAHNHDLHQAIRVRAGIHLDETRAHAEQIERCLRMLGAEPSKLKTAAARTLELARSITTIFANDERVKDYLAATGEEHFEVACYKALIAASGDAHEDAIIPLLQHNLKEDQAMARWLDDNIEVVVRDYFRTAAAAVSR
jgi:ferritin-like metal-binding protein YciE